MAASEKTEARTTDAARAAQMLADEIITDEIAAGSRLYIRELVARTGLGPTPLREGVTRLVARGLVEIVEQRGFYVAAITEPDIEDLFWLLSIIEHAALRRAMESADNRWANRIEQARDDFMNFKPSPRERPSTVTRRFCDLHKALHMAFVAGCGSPRTLKFLDILYDQEARICHARTTRAGRLQDLQATCDADRHAQLAAYVIRRDFEHATATLVADRNAVSRSFGFGPALQQGHPTGSDRTDHSARS